MKVYPFKVLKADNATLLYQIDRGNNLYNKFHQHDEYQISFIEHGEGRLLVGDSVYQYKEGDVFLLGENLPHVFYVNEECEEVSVVRTVYFSKDMLGRNILSFEEFSELVGVFEASKSGICFLDKREAFRDVFLKFENSNGLERIIHLFDLLNILLKSKYMKLATFVYTNEYTDLEGKRMSDVMNYTIANYNKPITLEEIADKANMNRNSFCRYFKQRTNKSYFQFLIEIRIESACRDLVQHKDYTIVEISEKCGFHNVSNFNRKFREIKGTSPQQYRKSKLNQLPTNHLG